MTSNEKLKTSKLHISDDNVSSVARTQDMDKRAREARDSGILHGFNLNEIGDTKGRNNFIEKCLVFLSLLLVVVAFPISLFTIFVVVRQFERALILRNGKLHNNKAYGPGLTFYLPCIDTIKFTDLRIVCYAIPPQEALTKDALTVAVDAVIYYKINDPIWAVVNVADYKTATQYLAATTLRNALGTRKLSEILVDRPAVSYQVFGNMKNLTTNWGVKIVRFELKDISLPLQLQKTMATEAESSRLANAKIIVAKAEIESTKSLQKATKLLMDNPYCMQPKDFDLGLPLVAGLFERDTAALEHKGHRKEHGWVLVSKSLTLHSALLLRYLQALQLIAGDKTHTIVVPFSIDTLKSLFK